MEDRSPVPKGPLRCAIYTRKSTEEGLEQEFNSLDAQREAAAAYILSQRHEGWTSISDRYDDGGYSGAHMDRPALKRLLEDVSARRIDCLVVYKVDRLTRSLRDFGRIMEALDRQGVSFVSVTQLFNTNTSLGRLTLHILLSFAQFEREIIGERTRDKMSAARRKGKWTGGYPVLGYDIQDGRLVPNPAEAARVREVYQLFLAHGTLGDTLTAIQRRGWTLKSWTTASGQVHTGRPFTQESLSRLLRNVVYTGSVRHKGEVHPGEQDRIVDAALWDQVHQLLQSEVHEVRTKQKQEGCLKGLLHCQTCGRPMVLTCTTKRRQRYRYYICAPVRNRGGSKCTAKPLAVDSIEKLILAQLFVVSQQSQCEPLRQALSGPNGFWSSFIEAIDYDGPRQRVSIRLRRIGEALEDDSALSFVVPNATISSPAHGEPEMAVPGAVPRIARLMALAIKFEGMLQDAMVRDYADLARLGRVSRARMTQIMELLNLAPSIQERLLFFPPNARLSVKLVAPVAKHPAWAEQVRLFDTLVPSPGTESERVNPRLGDRRRTAASDACGRLESKVVS